MLDAGAENLKELSEPHRMRRPRRRGHQVAIRHGPKATTVFGSTPDSLYHTVPSEVDAIP
jgi:hypothetical protein